MTNNTQYQQNINIINKFFKRPITLITGILSILSSFTFTVAVYYTNKQFFTIMTKLINNFFSNFVSDSQNFTTFYANPLIIVSFFPILFGISFIMLHFFSDDNGSKTQRLTKFFRITALVRIIFTIVSAFAILSLSFILNYLFYNKLTMLLSVCTFGIIAFLIILNTARYRFAKSINKSVKSIYIRSKGSIFFAICNFICVLFALPILGVLLSTYIFVGTRFFFSLLPCTVFLIVFITEKLFGGFTAIKYAKYIGNIIYGKISVISDPPMSDYEKQVTDEFLAEISSEKEDIKNTEKHLSFSPVVEKTLPDENFIFKTETSADDVSDSSTFKEKEDDAKDRINLSNSFADTQNESMNFKFAIDEVPFDNTFTCPDCGAPYTEEDFFCNVCGRKLI